MAHHPHGSEIPPDFFTAKQVQEVDGSSTEMGSSQDSQLISYGPLPQISLDNSARPEKRTESMRL